MRQRLTFLWVLKYSKVSKVTIVEASMGLCNVLMFV